MSALLLTATTVEAQATSASPERSTKGVAALSWMSGCWERRSTARLTEERWTPPRAGIMLGSSITTRGDTLVEYEQIRIFARDGKLVYAAHPSGQRPAEFTEIELSNGSVIFANPAHDFPQRVMYRRISQDSMIASVDGPRNGSIRTLRFPYARVSCS